jgi:CelD/BcsL family acetyltransferase involved in cellulose biosynthesis
VLRGGAAVRAAIGDDRRVEWQRLAAAQDKVTVFGEPGFVLTWYEVYEPEYDPLLLIGLDAADRLIGVMSLAVPRDAAGSLVFAGAEQCEYAGWLAAPEIERDFARDCILELRRRGLFRRPWRWTWLVPGTDVAGLDAAELGRLGLPVRLTRSLKSLWSLQGGKPVRFSVDNWHVNRLKRHGELRLVRLAPATLTDEVFRAFTNTHDLRELHIRGFDPFRASPLKGVFHRRLVDRAPDSVLFYALMVGSAPAAFSFSLLDRRRVVLCLDAFDPRMRASSPGKLIHNLVADALAADGILAVDLTPGGDPYKQEVANDTEEIYSALLFPGRARAWSHGLKERAEQALKRAVLAGGLSRDRARELAGTAGRLATGALVRDLASAGRRWVLSEDGIVQYQWDRGGAAAPPDEEPDVRIDALEDFLAYAGTGRPGSRQDMMQEVMSRLRRRQRSYTVLEDGRLALAGWLESEAKSASVGDQGVEWQFPAKTARLHLVEAAVTASTAGRRGLVRSMMATAIAGGAEQIVVLVRSGERSFIPVLEAEAFRLRRRLTVRRRFGRVQTMEDPA